MHFRSNLKKLKPTGVGQVPVQSKLTGELSLIEAISKIHFNKKSCEIAKYINKDGFLLKIDGLGESYDSSLKQAKGIYNHYSKWLAF